MGDEDGNCFKQLEDGAEKDLLQVMEDYGVERFVEKHTDNYPESWSTEEAVLIEYEVKLPKEVKVITKLEI